MINELNAVPSKTDFIIIVIGECFHQAALTYPKDLLFFGWAGIFVRISENFAREKFVYMA